MLDALFLYIEQKSAQDLSEQEKNIVAKAFTLKKLRKRQYFLQQGDVCGCLGFIVKGATRMYSVDSRGNEHVLQFGVEQLWVGDDESYNMLYPSKYNIETVEETWLLTIGYEKIQEIIGLSPAIAATFRAMQIQATIKLSKRLHRAISLNAEERFDDLLHNEPVFLARFPQTMIASYLGIKPETLSRIKSNVLRKKPVGYKGGTLSISA
jgi:CRP-like cAMP-binding protein